MTAVRTVAPVSRVDALRHLAQFVALAAAVAPDNDDIPAIRRQARCDLHALGVTSDELDAAGLR